MQQYDKKKQNAASAPRILALEGDEINRYLLEKVLAMNGCVADSVDSAGEILDILVAKNATYNLLIINICAPIKDDLKLVRTIRALPDQYVSNIPILATTTAIHPDIKQKCQAEGIVDVIMKPFNILELSQIIKQCMLFR